jgi:hypothetical protein
MRKRYISPVAVAAVAIFSLGPAAYAEFFQAPYGPGDAWNVYEVVTAGATFADANAAASTASWNGTNGHLLHVGSAAENNTVHRKAGFGDVWIGLTDREFAAPPGADGDGDPTPQESQTFGTADDKNRIKGWAWTSGETVTFLNWADNEPNDSGGEDAAHLRNDGQWNDHKSGYAADAPMMAMIQPGTSTDESGGPSFKYVIEYPVESPTQLAGVPLHTVMPPTPMPGIPGGPGSWGLVEVRGVDPGGNITSTINNLLTDPPPAAAQIFTDRVPKLDLTDPETNANGGPVLGDAPIPFLSDTKDGEPGFPGNPDPNNGDDNWIHTVAKGRLKVLEAGDYTIQVRSDDGFALKVHGGSFSVSSGAGQIDPADAQTIFFPRGTGDSNTKGLITLTEGEYDVEFVSWEGGGGAYYEVTSAKGDFLGSNLYTQWLALGDPSRVETAPSVVRLVAPANVINGPDADNITDTITAIRAAIKDPASPRGTADAVMLIGAADENPCCNRPSEKLPRDLLTVFPNGGGDEYTAGVFGTFLVDNGNDTPNETLQMTFGLFTDDGVALHIFGESFTEKGANGDLVALDGDTMIQFDGFTGNSNTYGLIELQEGTYGFEAFLFEGGGGSGLEIFVAEGDQRDAYNVGTFAPLSINPDPVFVNQGMELVPEPSGLALACLSLLGLLGLARRRNG